jgi:hypothetical protein
MLIWLILEIPILQSKIPISLVEDDIEIRRKFSDTTQIVREEGAAALSFGMMVHSLLFNRLQRSLRKNISMNTL